mmetsp:Transcript_43852/g.117654  ORF Transcript_43852/g.117654 Transcript_43852/m.117654 type:complete len:95 (-) Transcript_43852:878-1162(-)
MLPVLPITRELVSLCGQNSCPTADAIDCSPSKNVRANGSTDMRRSQNPDRAANAILCLVVAGMRSIAHKHEDVFGGQPGCAILLRILVELSIPN